MTEPLSDVSVSAAEPLMALAPKLAQLGTALSRGRVHEKATELADVSLERPALQILLTLLGAGGPLRVGEIAAEMQVEGPHVTRHAQRLEKKGLVQRVVDPQDRRARLIELTPEGGALARRYRSVVMNWLARAIVDWSEQDRDELVRLATRMVDDILDYLREEVGDD
ncbi:MarR family winged helix-turn-helix transcriptional regulator [Streptomyces sp. NPDC001480]|uniref:MarR family winged helix-turn-helix transcriptional regulator n=1 Tax=Streptomyces sp. NPDC001480 TaxID=3364577 RepID=UPI0036C62473